MIDYRELAPPPALAGYVRCIWRLTGGGAGAGAAQPIVPDGCVEIVLNFADPFIRHPVIGDREVQPLLLLAGQITRAITIEPTGRVDLCGVRFHPWSAARFLGISGFAIRDHVVALDDVSRRLAARFAPVADARDDATRLARLVEALLARAWEIGPADSLLPTMVGELCTSRAPLSVADLARRLSLGTRRVQAVFREQIGLTPKQLQRIGRLQRALWLARTHENLTLSAIAARAGYYDHAHLVHDSVSISGMTPSALLGKEGGLTEAFLADPSISNAPLSE